MKIFLFTLCFISLISSCGQKDDKNKNTEPKKETIGPIADTTSKNTDTTKNQVSDSTKTMKMTFSSYEEGDYPHLLFKETATGKEYDFGFPDDNKLNGLDIVLKDGKASFGYTANKKWIGSTFKVETVSKMTDTYDDNGQPIKGKAWRITDIQIEK